MNHMTRLPGHPFTSAHARQLGLSSRHIDDLVRNRDLDRPLRGVYLRSDVEQTPLMRARAAALVVSSHSVICDRTAAWILGVDAHRYRDLDSTPPLESYVLRGHQATHRPECNGGVRDLRPSDWIEMGGVRVTTPLRTAMDLGCKLSRRDALAAMDALMRAYSFSQQDMRRLLPRYRRRRGVVQLRRLVPLVDGRAESSGESWMRLEIIDRGLPAPTPQYWVQVDGVPMYRLDLAYRHARVAIEYDGEEFHARSEAAARDEERRSWLRAHGWVVIVLTKHSFTEEAIMVWIRELRASLQGR